MTTPTLRFLVVRIGMTGDTLFATPLLRSLRHAFPTSVVEAVVSPRGRDILSVVGSELGVTRLITYDIYHPKLGKWWLRRTLESGHYDAVFFLDTNLHYLEMIKSLVTADQWYRMVSERDSRGGVQVVQNETAMHIVDQYLSLAESMGVAPVRSYQFSAPDSSRRWGAAFRDRFRSGAKLVGIHWGNHSKNTNILFPKESFDGRSWKIDGFLKMAQLIHSCHPEAVFILTGGTYEARMVKRLHKQLLRHKMPVVNMAGKTNKMVVFLGLLSCLDVFVVGDTGPMHLASGLNKKTVMLTFSTNPDETGPYRSPNTSTVGAGLPCMPCLNRVHERQCPPINCSDSLDPTCVANMVMERIKE